MDKRFLGILAAIVIVFGVVFAITQNSNNNSNNSGGNASSTQPTSHVEGQGSTGVKLVEYGDYECPICGEYYQPLKQVYAQFSSQIYFQFRNLPLTQIHPNAFAGARAAEAAGLQGKYWLMHDQLYENQDPNGTTGWVASSDPLDNYFVGFAKNIGITNIAKFKSDYASEYVNNKINADLNAFAKTGQPMATPTFFLDGKYIPNTELVDKNGVSVAKFAQIINAEITKKKQS